jgi:hypothetical protein
MDTSVILRLGWLVYLLLTPRKLYRADFLAAASSYRFLNSKSFLTSFAWDMASSNASF